MNFLANLLAWTALAVYFIGFPVLAYIVIGHWLRPSSSACSVSAR